MEIEPIEIPDEDVERYLDYMEDSEGRRGEMKFLVLGLVNLSIKDRQCLLDFIYDLKQNDNEK